jgi:hypothetical protein
MRPTMRPTHISLIAFALLVAAWSCAPPATPDAADAAAAADAHVAGNAALSDDALLGSAPDPLGLALPLPANPVVEDFARMCDLAVAARRAGKMGDEKLAAVAEAFEAQGQTEQVKRLLATMLNVPVSNRCLLLQTGARRAELPPDQLCTALCPMVRYDEAALKDVKLPVSSSDTWASPNPQWTVVASEAAVRVGKLPIVPLFDGAIDPAFKDGHVVRAIQVMLAVERHQAQAASAQGAQAQPATNPAEGVALLVVDARANASLLLDLIATLQAEGARRFEVMLQGGGQLGEAPPSVDAAHLSDDAVLRLRARAEPLAAPMTPRVQVWLDEMGALITTFGPDGAPQQALQPACQRTVCALESEHPIGRVHWIQLYNALLAARDAAGAGVRTLEVAAGGAMTVEVLAKLVDLTRHTLAEAPGGAAQPIPLDQLDALSRWQPARNGSGQPLALLDDVVLAPSVEVGFPPPPQVPGLQLQGMPSEAQPTLSPEAFYLRACFDKHGKGLATSARPWMAMATLTLASADGRVSDVRLMEMSTASGVVPKDLQACFADRLGRLRFPATVSPLRFLLVLEP